MRGKLGRAAGRCFREFRLIFAALAGLQASIRALERASYVAAAAAAAMRGRGIEIPPTRGRGEFIISLWLVFTSATLSVFQRPAGGRGLLRHFFFVMWKWRDGMIFCWFVCPFGGEVKLLFAGD